MISHLNISKATPADIDGVLDLQRKYLVSNLTLPAQKDGFVTTPFTIEQIEQVMLEDGLFIAKHENEVVAYIFAGSWAYFNQWPIFPLMTKRFANLTFKNTSISVHNSFQYGPICIDKAYRGTGLLNKIFEYMRLNLQPKYPISITFINKINGRSIKAHTEKLKWATIDEFEFNGNHFLMLAFDMNISVL
ncbi:MAG: GNAT family acetyltransferase [Bacteroidota bacterium]